MPQSVSAEESTESDALRQIVGELRAQFPTVAQEVILEHVRRAHARMDAAPVQDYVPVLVQRQARLSLTAMINTGPTASSGAEHLDSA